MGKRNSKGLKRKRKFFQRTLFYAGFFNDGSPRGWNLADVFIAIVLLIAVVVVGIFVFEWLWTNF
ncbi:MAG: hypothetical protein CMI31_03030 [Opitutae bacterium]|nr:hypothetical protein [Opitutae bacterium]|tara:strand:- start:516 stop:710 length:195 start_codon:yes stop_codon:yes gene_type:complete